MYTVLGHSSEKDVCVCGGGALTLESKISFPARNNANSFLGFRILLLYISVSNRRAEIILKLLYLALFGRLVDAG